MEALMPCFHPLKAQRSHGGVTILGADAPIWSFKVPCGQCVGCRLERSRQWAVRCMHESQMHDSNCFVTLTYSPEHLPADNGLHHEDFQRFMKRLRKAFPNDKIRYYMAGEYGGEFGRPHFHAILFNVTFPDLVYYRKSPAGHSLYRSAILERLWPIGFSSVGAVTFDSAAYVARYIMKKITGDAADSAYWSVDTNTGEMFKRNPEYNAMSLKPGIGSTWFDKYRSDVFPHDEVVIDGTKSKPPRYYDKLLHRSNPELLTKIKSQRVVDMEANWMDNTTQRLISKEIVKKAALSKLSRKL